MAKRALADNQYQEVVIIGKLTAAQAHKIKLRTGMKVSGYTRVITADGVRHTHKEHGNAKRERQRGQVAIGPADYARIVDIVASDNVIYGGQNKTGNDCLLYEAELDGKRFYIEAIFLDKKRLALNTMFRRRPMKVKRKPRHK